MKRTDKAESLLCFLCWKMATWNSSGRAIEATQNEESSFYLLKMELEKDKLVIKFCVSPIPNKYVLILELQRMDIPIIL